MIRDDGTVRPMPDEWFLPWGAFVAQGPAPKKPPCRTPQVFGRGTWGTSIEPRRCPTCGGLYKTDTCRLCDPPLANLDDEGLPWTDEEIEGMVDYMPTLDEIDASRRIIRHYGFQGHDQYHPPWTDDDHQRRAGGDLGPYETPETNPLF